MNSRSAIAKEKFRLLADTVATYDNDPDYWIENQEFEDQLWDLFHDRPDWRRIIGSREPSPRASPRGRRRRRPSVKVTTNRAILNCRKNLAAKKLEAETIETIWKWADDPAYFLAEANNHKSNACPDGAALPPKPLDSVCILLSRLEKQGQVDRIRQRLLLCFLAWMVQEVFHAVGTQDDVVTLLIQAQLISEASRENATKSLPTWLSRGRQYLYLAERLGGVGAVIFLPLWGESNWYHHGHAGGKAVDELIASLEARGVMREASQERHDQRNAYDVVHKLFQGLRTRGGHSFVPSEAISPSPRQAPPAHAHRVRRSRLVPSSPPRIDQQMAQGALLRHPIEPDLSSFHDDAPGHWTPEVLHSPSIMLPHEDECRILCLPTV